MGKRILLFLLTNILVIATISLFLNIFGIKPYLDAQGINYMSLLIFCSIWGMGGAFISLALSKTMAKHAMGVQLIDPKSASGNQRELLNIVYSLARKIGLQTMPEVGIYDSPELNAFATGPTKHNSLVAVSTGLLHNMNHDEVQAVLGHEISHVANGDMVTMTLIQGVVNSFALFLSRIIAYAVSVAMSRGEGDTRGFSFITYYALSFLFDIVLTLLGSILVAAFSRWREYRADAGGARLTGRDKMIAALKALGGKEELEEHRSRMVDSLKISNHPRGIRALFSSHPPLTARIERLQRGQY